MKKIPFIMSPGAGGESTRFFSQKLQNGFWDKYIRYGTVVDFGYKGGKNFSPLFNNSIGLDLDTPGYDGKNFPYGDNSIGTILASHVLEHLLDYGYFFRECFRCLMDKGTLILSVPLKDTYERQNVPISRFNHDHKRFYTASRLLYEIETQLPRNIYRIIYLEERFNVFDLNLPLEKHATGPYEIECVLEKIS